MVVFFDTSALLKRYRLEAGTDAVEKILSKATQVILSPITRSEAVSALSAHRIRGALTKADYASAYSDLETDFPDYKVIPLDSNTESVVIRVAEKYGYKALNNIQLASALVARPRYFVTGDKKLARLAKLEKLKVKLV